jgi:pimeloyl-ACP methyl ester carboxylesterase
VEPVVPVPASPETIEFRGCDGIRLVADAWGRPDWPPVIFLHGGGQTRHSWGGTARAMAEHGWYAVTLDARGHGDSDWSPERHYEATHFAADVAEVVHRLGKPPVLVGASLGGITSLVAVGEGLLEARAVVLVDITPKIEREGVDRIHAFMEANLDGFDTVEDAGDAVAAYRRHRSRPKDVSGLRKNLRFRSGRYFWHWDPEFMAMRRDADTEREERLRAAARRIRVPALLVRGHSSDVVSAEGVRQFLEDVPHAKCIDVNGAGHMVAGDRNDVFTEAVMGFLEETLPTTKRVTINLRGSR